MKIHRSVTIRRVMQAMKQEDYPGFCLACGQETSGVEPDARNYPCEACDKRAVYGAEEILFLL